MQHLGPKCSALQRAPAGGVQQSDAQRWGSDQPARPAAHSGKAICNPSQACELRPSRIGGVHVVGSSPAACLRWRSSGRGIAAGGRILVWGVPGGWQWGVAGERGLGVASLEVPGAHDKVSRVKPGKQVQMRGMAGHGVRLW